MNHGVRVMLVDDSPVVRTLVTQALAHHHTLQLVASAGSGALALGKLEQLEIDVLVLDLELPDMDGLTMLRHLHARYPRLPVMVFSSQTERGRSATFDALAAGANDYMVKPSAGEELEATIAQGLIPKLMSLTSFPSVLAPASAMQPAAAKNNMPRAPAVPASPFPEERPTGTLRGLPAVPREGVRVIGVAASTGGPNALAELLSRIPGSLPVPILIAQHMPPLFTRTLAERLAVNTELHVCESAGGERLLPGHVYIAPGNQHIEVVRRGSDVLTQLSDAPPENSCRPSADVLFRSLARHYGGSVLAVVLTGMGQDGVRGARELHTAGARILAQSGPTCVVWGMPRAVEAAGLAEAIIPLPEMASAVMQRVGSGLTPALTRAAR